MEQDEGVRAYRDRLLGALHEVPERRREDTFGFLRVFVNEEGVGTLNCFNADPALVFVSRERPIQTIEIRTESGGLVGRLSAPTTGMKTQQLRLSAAKVDVTVHNQGSGGLVNIGYHSPSRAWERVQRAALSFAGNRLATTSWRMTRPRAAVMAQVLLACAVLFLLSERFAQRGQIESKSESGTVALSHEDVAQEGLRRLEDRLVHLTQAQTATRDAVHTQQQELSRVYQAVQQVSHVQQQIRGNVTAIEHRVDAVSHDLLAAKESLEKNRVALARTGEAKDSSVSEAVNLSKTVTAAPNQLADARREDTLQSVRFWVAFRDGTSEKSIDELMEAIHGRRGQAKAGWQNVEVSLSRPQTQDGFLESLKKEKIVRAVTANPASIP